MRAGPLSSSKIIKLLNTHFVNVWVLLRELPELQAGAKGAAAGALATKLQQHYTDSVDILTLSPELEVIEHLPGRSLLARDYLPRHERIPLYLELLKSSASIDVAVQKANRDKEMLQRFKKLEEQYPERRSISRRLAELHEALGNAELAMEYRRKAEPTLALIGKPVPDFCDVDSATDLDGNPISLQQYRGKVVLLDFWAVWSGFCIGEMPTVKKVYDTYKDEGFDIIGVNLDTDETKLRNYLKENDIPWRQIFSGQERQCPLAQQYGVLSIPARWLIDRDGKLISLKARSSDLKRLVGEDLERVVAEAVADKSNNP